MESSCLVCRTLTGEILPPGGVILENPYWQVDHALPPIFIPGMLIIKLKRHCEHLAGLTADEAQVFGPLVPRVCGALQQVTGAEKVHLASFGEGFQHVHFLVRPRTSQMPPSNFRLTVWLLWRRIGYWMGFRQAACPEPQAAEIAKQVRERLSA